MTIEPATKATGDDVEPAPASEGAPQRSVTLRAIVVGIVFTFLAGFWVREAEIKEVGVFISESVPTIPAFAAVLLLLLWNAMARGRRGAFSRGEMVFTFFFVAVATTTYCCGVVRILLAYITAPFYFMQSGNRLADAQGLIPKWAAVHDTAVVKGMYDSLHGDPVPWGPWLVPALAWIGFFVALWLTTMCMVLMMHRPWVEKEKLAFPLVQLPLEITDLRPRAGGIPAFLKNPVMWAGFALSAVFDGGHIVHALVPSFPLFGGDGSFRPFNSPPWDAFGTITWHRRPILIGFGYLVSAEISFSIWATYFLERLAAVAMSAVGYREAGMPFIREQSLGAYVGVAVMLVLLNRRHLAAITRAAVSSASPEMRGYRFAFWGFFVGLFAVLTFCRMLGMMWWVAALYLGILLAVSLTFARVRAEAGIPLAWLFPYGMQKTMLVNLLGTGLLAPGGAPGTLSALATLTFLQYSCFMSFSGYQVETLRVGHALGERPRRIIAGLTLALVVGLVFSFYFHLTGFYDRGAQQVYGGLYGAGGAAAEHSAAIVNAATPLPPDKPRVFAGAAGFGIVCRLQVLRMHGGGFPLHPLGFATANAYGHLLWVPFLMVWVIKVVVLRAGGMALYRKTIPAFLGYTLGHFFTSGVFWGLLGAFYKAAFQGYIVCFG